MSTNTSTKELMVHVERIVRPLEASGGRKLRMRRELLAHLEAALDEERQHPGAEEEVVERAKRRLGDPAVLREQLQRSVPWLERWMLREFPAPVVLKRWEKRSEQDWSLLSTAQTIVMVICCAMITFLSLAVAGLVTDDNRLTFFALQASDPWGYTGKCMVAGILTIGVSLLIISLMGKAMRERAWSRAVVGRAVGFTVVEFAWVVMVNSELMGHPVARWEIVRCVAMGAGIAVLQVGASRLVVRMGNHAAEWKELEIA